MKHVKYALAGIVGLSSLVGPVLAQVQPAVNASVAVQVQPPTVDVQGTIDQINSAKDSAQVIDVYSRSMDAAPDNVPIMRAYVHRLVDLDVPQFATPVAEKLIRLAPDDALAWAVIGVSEAKRGNMPDALSNECYAALKAPEDPFIQKSAGQMLAWYDSAAQKPALSDNVKSQVDRVRQAMANRDAYTRSYKDASEFYAKSQQPENTTPPVAPNDVQAPAANQPIANQPVTQQPYADQNQGYYNPNTYATPGAYAPVYSYPSYPYYTNSYPAYSYPYYYSDYSYPYYYPGIYFGSGFFFGGGHFHDHGGFHGGFHDGGHFDGRHGGDHFDAGHGGHHR